MDLENSNASSDAYYSTPAEMIAGRALNEQGIFVDHGKTRLSASSAESNKELGERPQVGSGGEWTRLFTPSWRVPSQ